MEKESEDLEQDGFYSVERKRRKTEAGIRYKILRWLVKKYLPGYYVAMKRK